MKLSDTPNTNSQILIETAKKQGIEVKVLDKEKLKLRLKKNGKIHTVTKKSFGLNSLPAIQIARDKDRTNRLLKKHKIPTPTYIKITNSSDLENRTLPPFPLIVKPAVGEKGRDIFADIRDQNTLEKTVNLALKNNKSIIIQRFIKGQDLRFFVLNGKAIGAAIRRSPQLIGNGKNNIQTLIQKHNRKLVNQRKKTGKRMQNRILNRERVSWHLENQGLSLHTIPEKGQTLTPYPITNFQAGGTVETVPLSEIHPSIIRLAEKTIQITGLTVSGIDMIVKNPTQPLLTRTIPVKQTESRSLTRTIPVSNAWVIEVNSDPSLRLHEWPNQGEPQLVSKKLIEFIFSS